MNLYTVSTLADSGQGSLREGVSQPNRLIRFAVSGQIDLQTSLKVTAANLLVDGFSAPGPVTLRWYQLHYAPALDIHETLGVTVRGLTIDAEASYPVDANHDCIRVWNSNGVTVSRCTLLHAYDESVEIHSSQNVVLAENWIKDPTPRADDSAGFGVVIYGPTTDKVLLWRNVFDGCTARTPMIAAGKRIAVVNNVIRGQRVGGWQGYVYAYDYPPAPAPFTQVDFESNLYEPPLWWQPWLHVGGVASQPSPGITSLYLRGNIDSAHRISDAQDQRLGVEIHDGTISWRTSRAWAHGAKVVPASELRGMTAGAP